MKISMNSMRFECVDYVEIKCADDGMNIWLRDFEGGISLIKVIGKSTNDFPFLDNKYTPTTVEAQAE